MRPSRPTSDPSEFDPPLRSVAKTAPIYSHGCLENQRFGPGTCQEELRVHDWLREDDGRIPVGALALLADSANGFALSTALDDSMSLVTAQLRIELFRPAPREERLFHGAARAMHVDADVGYARGIITTAAGDRVAMTSMRSAHLRRTDLGTAAGDARSAGGSVITDGTIDELLGTRTGGCDGPGTAVQVVARPDLANSAGNVHGGVLAMMGERALVASLAEIDRPERFRPLDLEVSYLRPLAGTAGTVTAVARITNLSRRFVQAVCEVVLPDGRPATVIRATYGRRVEAALPQRPEGAGTGRDPSRPPPVPIDDRG